jgi:hypothetical protein
MILGLLRTRLQGARRIPLSIGKFPVGFEPLRQILGAPHGYRSVELSGGNGTGEGKIESIGPIEIEEEISLPPARFAIGNEVESKLLPCRLVANARPVYLLRNGKYRNTTGHFELAVLDAGGQPLSELSPDAIGPGLHRIYGQFSLQKEQRIRGRAIVLPTPGARGNYFHWCLELLPKIHLLRSLWPVVPRKEERSSTKGRSLNTSAVAGTPSSIPRNCRSKNRSACFAGPARSCPVTALVSRTSVSSNPAPGFLKYFHRTTHPRISGFSRSISVFCMAARRGALYRTGPSDRARADLAPSPSGFC